MSDPNITVTEADDSPEYGGGDNPFAITRYVIRADQAITHTQAVTALLEMIGITYDGLIRQNYNVEHLPGREDLWKGYARYGLASWQPSGSGSDSRFAFETAGGSQHITQSIATIGSYAASGQATPDFKGAIGVTSSGVQGVDITVPVFNFTETHYKQSSLVTVEYQDNLFRLTGKVNDIPFRAFNAGEVLFLGAAGSIRGSYDWEITYKFAALWNQSDISIGEITGISKEGWQYMWISYEASEDDTAKALIQQPQAVYIEQVYPYGNFELLEI